MAGIALGRMEANISAVLHADTACISALHCLKVYAQRLGVDLQVGLCLPHIPHLGCSLASGVQHFCKRDAQVPLCCDIDSSAAVQGYLFGENVQLTQPGGRESLMRVRLWAALQDGDMVQRCCGNAFLLVTEALVDVATLQYPPSVTAAAVLLASRKAQVRDPSLHSTTPQHTCCCCCCCASWAV